MTQLHPWRAYAERVVAGKADAPKYVIKQVRELIAIADGEDERYFLDTHRLEQIDALAIPQIVAMNKADLLDDDVLPVDAKILGFVYTCAGSSAGGYRGYRKYYKKYKYRYYNDYERKK